MSKTTPELTFTGAGHLVSELVQIVPKTCLHPEVFGPSGYSLIDHVANMYCPLCNAKVDTGVSTCPESCTECNEPADNSNHDSDSEDTDESIGAVEPAPVRPWRQLILTSTWLKPTKQNTASVFNTPRTPLQASNDLCLTCNEQEHPIIWCRGCNFGECKLCIDTRGYLRCLCSVDNSQPITDASMQKGIYAYPLNSGSMMIINRSRAVLVESENFGAGTILDLPETLFAVNDDGEITYLAPICKDLRLPLDHSAFHFLSLDPCIIITNTSNFSIEQLGNLEWISINLMRDPFTSVQLYALSHDLNVACGAVQHSRPEVWKQSVLLSSDKTPHHIKVLG